MTEKLTLMESPNPKKKWRVEFPDSTHVDFGASGYKDFTQHNDLKRKEAYISRHRSREIWTLEGVHTAGFWSRWVLWNQPTIDESIKDINKRFKEEHSPMVISMHKVR
jgi:hypothetical protein